MARTPNIVLKARRDERKAAEAYLGTMNPMFLEQGSDYQISASKKFAKDYNEKRAYRIRLEKTFGIKKKKMKDVS